MTTLAIIFGILLTLSIWLNIRLIKNVSLWRESYFLKEKSCEYQTQTIENQQSSIDMNKQIIEHYGKMHQDTIEHYQSAVLEKNKLDIRNINAN